MTDDYTIQYTKDDLTIDFYDDYNGEITVSYGGNTYTLGQDIFIGDTIPIDAVINVPKGSTLEVSNKSLRMNIKSAKNLIIPISIQKYNEYVQTEAFKKSMSKQKALGIALMVAGPVVFFVGALAESPSCIYGFHLMATGAILYGTALNGQKSDFFKVFFGLVAPPYASEAYRDAFKRN